MADVKWIKIATEIFDNRKIKQIEKMPEGDGIIVIWFKLLCLAGNVNDGGMVYFTNEMPYTEEMLSTEFDRPLQIVRLALRIFQSFDMVEIIDDVLYISSWEKYQNIDGLEKIREQNRLRKQKKRDRLKLTECHVTRHDNVTQYHATDIDKELDIDKNINNNNVQISKADIDTLFEQLWTLYPNKKGKGQISDAKKKALYKIGIEELTRSIERYKKELAKETWRKPQNGSTFFNNGYVDYLDTNYEPSGKEINNGCIRSNENGLVEEALKAGISTDFGGFS